MSTVFLTGFPGFLGSALVERLLDRHDADTTVTCLVQPAYRSRAEESRAELDAANADTDAAGRVELVEGDVTESDLGLDAYDDLLSDTIEIYHLAAVYDLAMDREPGKAVNIEGTRHVLDFAAGVAELNRLHYVSSVVVAGDYEGRFTEAMLEEGQRYFNYYESSKHAAEVLVQERMDAIPTTIYRPGPAVGDSETGETQKYDGPYAFIEALEEQGSTAIVPAPYGASDHEFNVVPRDYVVDAIAHLSGTETSEGEVYHLADPDPPSTTELIETLGRAAGKERTLVVPYPKELIKGVRRSLSVVLGESELVESGGLEYQTWPASFDCTNAAADLAGSGVECPRFEAYAENLVEFYWENPDVGTEGMS
jgi:thioester reductase-like protein